MDTDGLLRPRRRRSRAGRWGVTTMGVRAMRHTKRRSDLEFASMLLDVSAAARLELLEAYAEL